MAPDPTGLQQIQTVSFVNPQAVPGMADAEEVVRGFTRRPGVRFTGLWLNEKGLQRAISSLHPSAPSAMPTLLACRRGDLVWLPETAHLAQLEDQLSPNGLRQLPVFALDHGGGAALPHGLPAGGLPLAALRGMASRDGMARALAKHLTQVVVAG